MIEAATDPRIKDAFRAAHAARSQVLNDFLDWLTGSK